MPCEGEEMITGHTAHYQQGAPQPEAEGQDCLYRFTAFAMLTILADALGLR